MNSWTGKWQPHHRGVEMHYNNVLHTFLIDDAAWAIFKRYQTYNGIVGGDNQPYEIGRQYWDAIREEFPYLLGKLPAFLRNDEHGDPIVHNYDGTVISAGTLAYMYTLGDMEREFGPFQESDMIVEIGGGYGGQMLITLLHCPILQYNLIDLPFARLVSQKYMQYFPDVREKTGIGFYSTDLLPPDQHNLVISNFCLTELDDAGIDSYLENVFMGSDKCYILSNFYANDLLRCRDKGRQERLIARLEEIYKIVTVQDFVPGSNSLFSTAKIVGKGAK